MRCLIVTIALFLYSIAQGNTFMIKDTVPNPFDRNRTQTGNDDQQSNNNLEPLLAYNFSGNNKNFSGLTPVINYGHTKTFGKLFWGAWDLGINPYAAGQINVDDSVSFIPGLMLPGIAGIKINNLIKYKAGEGQIIFSPLSFGLKLITNFSDSNNTIIQHNLRTGLGYNNGNWFQIGVQFTYGWHNATSESEESFKKIFKKSSTDIKYLTIILETYLNGNASQDNILFAEWRGLLDRGSFQGFPNLKILTIGFRKQLDIDNLFPAGKGN